MNPVWRIQSEKWSEKRMSNFWRLVWEYWNKHEENVPMNIMNNMLNGMRWLYVQYEMKIGIISEIVQAHYDNFRNCQGHLGQLPRLSRHTGIIGGIVQTHYDNFCNCQGHPGQLPRLSRHTGIIAGIVQTHYDKFRNCQGHHGQSPRSSRHTGMISEIVQAH